MNLSVKQFTGIAPKIWAFLHDAEQIGGIRIGEVVFSNYGGNLGITARLDEDAAGDGAAADAVRAIGDALSLPIGERGPYTSLSFASGRAMTVSVEKEVAGVQVRIRVIVDADPATRRAVSERLEAVAS